MKTFIASTTAVLACVSASAAELRPIGGLALDFDSTQVKSASFEAVAPTEADPASLKTFRGDRGEVLRAIVRDDVDLHGADEYFRSRIFQMKTMFTPQAAPYSGAITVDAACLSQTKLQEKIRDEKEQRSVLFLLNATEDFIYGTCSKEREKYASQYLLLYCKKEKQFYELRFFTPRSNRLTDSPIAHCRADVRAAGVPAAGASGLRR